MKVRVDKSMGIVTLLPEVLDNQTSRALASMMCAESENGQIPRHSPAEPLAPRCTCQKTKRTSHHRFFFLLSC
jgi:hypothetical protein